MLCYSSFILFAHLDEVHEAIVAVLQKVEAELAQEESDVQNRAAMCFCVPCHLFTLGYPPHSLPAIVRIILILQSETVQTFVICGIYI